MFIKYLLSISMFSDNQKYIFVFLVANFQTIFKFQKISNKFAMGGSMILKFSNFLSDQ